MHIEPLGYILIALVIFSLWAAVRILKRVGQRLGCIAVGYVWLVILCIGSLAFGMMTLLYDSLSNFTQGERIAATIVDFTVREESSSDDDSGPMYVPIIRFTAPNGEVITRQGNTGSGAEPVIGDTYVIYYDSIRDSLSNFSFASIALLTAGAVMGFMLSLAVFGVARYAMGCEMSGFWRFFRNFLTFFLIPLVLITFDALLIYGMIFNGPHPQWVYALLGVFIFGLTVTIWCYVENIAKKGVPKFRRAGADKWSLDWDAEE